MSSELCGQCHRNAAIGSAGNALAASHLSRLQGAAQQMSASYRKSEGRLSCLTCYGPHRNAERSTHAEYNAKCLAWHTPHETGEIACGFRPAGDCISCHMPEQEVLMPTGPRFHTHCIKLWPASKRGE